MKRVIIAGAGHGGLIASRILAENNYDVTVVEKMEEGALGYPWHDDFHKTVLDDLGISYKDQEYLIKDNVTFTSPNLKATITLDLPDGQRELAFPRKALYKILIAESKKKGVKFQFENEVTGPLVKDGIIQGITTKKGPIEGDMIIDAAGVNSNLRINLPEDYEIPKEVKLGQTFNAYRAYFNLIGEVPENPRFYCYFKFEGLRGIAWFRYTGGMADVLFGTMDQLPDEKIPELLEKMRKVRPELGTELLYGGYVATIPIARSPPKFIADNYACVGDSAFMTMPLMGSGIELAMRAGKNLAESIIEYDKINAESKNGIHYPIKFLWENYQVPYFLNHGIEMAGIDYLKTYMMASKLDEIDFLFEKQLITSEDMKKSVGGGGEVKITIMELLPRIFRGISRVGVLLSLKVNVDNIKKIKRVASEIPKSYDPEQIDAWGKKYNDVYADLEARIEEDTIN